MHLRAREKIGDGGEPDMGMRPHVDAAAWREIHRAEIIEEDEGPDAAPFGIGQDSIDDESLAEISDRKSTRLNSSH